MDKSELEEQLQAARRQLQERSELARRCREDLAYAEKHKLPTLKRVTEQRLKRYDANLLLSQNLVAELEKASGALPLK